MVPGGRRGLERISICILASMAATAVCHKRHHSTVLPSIVENPQRPGFRMPIPTTSIEVTRDIVLRSCLTCSNGIPPASGDCTITFAALFVRLGIFSKAASAKASSSLCFKKSAVSAIDPFKVSRPSRAHGIEARLCGVVANNARKSFNPAAAEILSVRCFSRASHTNSKLRIASKGNNEVQRSIAAQAAVT